MVAGSEAVDLVAQLWLRRAHVDTGRVYDGRDPGYVLFLRAALERYDALYPQAHPEV